ncbi:MAG: hypothetical protein IT580_20045 [Verrucomicrobiales bacterium]|nr:hypothetical protein [Verrucomicrobiales bacterium]
MQLTRTDNGLFDLVGFDVTYFESAFDSIQPAGLVTSAGGTSDITAQGSYGFTGAGFEGLSWVLMTSDVPIGIFGWQLLIDNIVVKNSFSNVPDAGSTGLLLSAAVGVLGLCLQRFRRS